VSKKKPANGVEALLPLIAELATSGIRLLKKVRELKNKRKTIK